MSTVDLPPPGVGPLSRLAPKPVKFVLNWGRRYSLWVFNFGLACCAIEFIATSMSRHDFIRLGVIPFAPGPRQADLMVVSGTVSDKMAPAVRRLYEQMPEPKYVISFGACSNCGGPYWDSYCVTKGVDQIIPVDVYVPGCPPRPEALLHGIIKLQEKIAAESLGDRYTRDGEPVAPAPAPRPLSATVLRRPLQPPPPADDTETQEIHLLPDAPETATAPPAPSATRADVAAPDDATTPLTPPEPHVAEPGIAPAPEDATTPLTPVPPDTKPEGVPVPPAAQETAAPPEPRVTKNTDVPAPPAAPEDETAPLTPVPPDTKPEGVPAPPAAEEAPAPLTPPEPHVTENTDVPEPPAAEDATAPVPHVTETPNAPAPGTPAAGPFAGADDRTAPLTSLRGREHDPSIIPGLTDDDPEDGDTDGDASGRGRR
ncbi:NADH-quinone oxidoreductase subunit B [Actinomadura hibisca]|uniref:NADH-quinone oxidoreductase subunit B n=1 Tax=Actinomadura hibisca TaxID=68565 RepID=UPI0009FD0C98|nr:NADH-quinone oxidoreductase subunit NuoB [Actinomadura hibisca]